MHRLLNQGHCQLLLLLPHRCQQQGQQHLLRLAA
jgi:hypothetical protein